MEIMLIRTVLSPSIFTWAAFSPSPPTTLAPEDGLEILRMGVLLSERTLA